jgi:hemerythrin-like domain-containing protein
VDRIFNRDIKGLIDEFPQVGTILGTFQVGCTTCQVGTCLLKDIVDIHPLSPEDELELMTQIARVIYPDQEIEIKIPEHKSDPSAGAYQYSPPMKKLVEEHQWILRLLSLIPALIEHCDLREEADQQRMRDAVDFIRSYADKYHHAKEEDILFKYFDESLDIIQVMFEDHKTARAHVLAVHDAIEAQDKASMASHLTAYGELLKDHIKREDEILYPWLDKQLSMHQVGQMFAQFAEVDDQFQAKAQACQQFIETLEEGFRLSVEGETV